MDITRGVKPSSRASAALSEGSGARQEEKGPGDFSLSGENGRTRLTLHLEGHKETFTGVSFGAEPRDRLVGEIVFQTGMVGYTDSLTDPSYRNQVLVLTYPLVGNYGVPDESATDQNGIPLHFESADVHVKALVVGSCTADPSHALSRQSLHDFLAAHGVTGIEGIDTRRLTQLLRTHGTVRGVIALASDGNDVPVPRPGADEGLLVTQVSRPEVRVLRPAGTRKVLVIDCGVKNNQLRKLLEPEDVSLVVCGVMHPDFVSVYEEHKCERLFISNGPGDPRDLQQFVEQLREFMGTRPKVPIFGICLGHQLMGLAIGLQVGKMKFGNRGQNLPCKLVGTPRTYTTTQNHGYAVQFDDGGCDDSWTELFRNLNDDSNEGLIHSTRDWFSVQFHPEAKAGPEDTEPLFGVFLNASGTGRGLFAAIKSALGVHGDEVSKTHTARKKRQKVLILGSGALRIGQSGEFDYSGAQAIKAFREENLSTVLVNPNIATVQTDLDFVERYYSLPVTPEFVEQVIETEHPDCIALSFGGQTALNCGAELAKRGILAKYNIEVLGTSVDSILMTEDRDVFKKHIQSIGERIPDGVTASTVEEAVAGATKIGYPVLVRAAFALGGLGSGFASDEDELRPLLHTSFSNSAQVIIDKSVRGWKEVEYEVVRDTYGNCICVCNMENLDPLGVHTGESIVVAPSQTLSNDDYQMLRNTAIKTVSSLNIVGECNIQYALDPHSSDYFIIEINARLSRSSALASKATGYPLAYVAAKLGLGYGLDELTNSITGTTTACFEPALDYCVVKIPRWNLAKFERVDPHIGSAMKSVGEGMSISRTFEEALQSALRMTGTSTYGLEPGVVPCTDDALRNPTYRRILAVATGLQSKEYSIDRIHDLSRIDKWFLHKMQRIVDLVDALQASKKRVTKHMIQRAKTLGFSDSAIAHYCDSTELVIRGKRTAQGVRPDVKKIDTVSAEFPCSTNYLYPTYATSPTRPIPRSTDPNKVLVLGSGVYKIGSSVEFDWSAVSCMRQLRAMGKKVIMVNCNPETVSTDYDEADVLYFAELTLETVLDVCDLEKPSGVIVSVGGQAANNIAITLHRMGVHVIGTAAESIDRAENRFKFSRMCDRLGVDQPRWKELTSVEEAIAFSHDVSYPVLVRPSYVLSGSAMRVAYSDDDLTRFLSAAVLLSKDHPVVISKFINDAKEIEVDAVADHGIVRLHAISEHVENAGVHSGDATVVYPAQDVTETTMAAIKESVFLIAQELAIHGPFNIQFIAKDDQVKVIECNLRVSRSFPFISKAMGVNMVGCATQMMLGVEEEAKWQPDTAAKLVGVKVPQFSFNRLEGADILLGVDMQSTGEVACFGRDLIDAYLKGLVASGFVMPPKGSRVLLSIGGYAFKREFRESAAMLRSLGYEVFATRNTASYLDDVVELRFHSATTDENVLSWVSRKRFALVINVTERNKMRCVEDQITQGYQLRRACIESNIPIVTDIKVAKLVVRCLSRWIQSMHSSIPVQVDVDCFTKHTTVRIPGLIDVHVHVRDPGETYKEDWQSCTRAALAGGITMICAMPNTTPPLCDDQVYEMTEQIASRKAVCDYALFAGASSSNADSVFAELGHKAAGLKMYLNNTHGPLLLDNTMDWSAQIANWTHPTHPICVHAEGPTLAAVLYIANHHKRRLHVCHVAREEEILLVKQAKQSGMRVTCEVAPHHLFLDDHALDASVSAVKPPLQKARDCQALWDHMDIIDCFATDHAPHTKDDKAKGCFGFPGLETALPLLLTAVHEGKLTLEQIVERYHTNPRRIFGLPAQPDTYVELDLSHRHKIPPRPFMSKAGWSPFAGKECVGAVKRVVLRGEIVYLGDMGKIVAEPGKGINVRLAEPSRAEPARTPVTTTSLTELRVPAAVIQRHHGRAQLTNVLAGQHLLSSEQFSHDWLRLVFERADEMRRISLPGSYDLSGKTLGLFFDEPSTRTRVSFEIAMRKLGGEVIHVAGAQSSSRKGEILQDSMMTLQMSAMADAVVLRQSARGAADFVSRFLSVPLINAGDGDGEHPTQTLIDLYTIRRELGTLRKRNVTLLGDLRYGRTVHSLAKALALSDVRLHYVSPEELRMPKEVMDYVTARGIEQTEHLELSDELLAATDVLYVTRIQHERFHVDEDQIENPYCITPSVLAKAKPDMRVLHPLPRGHEIGVELDTDPRAAYFRQMENGPYVRMAILSLILESKD